MLWLTITLSGYGFAPRPHIPVSKLVVSESYDTYISRSFQVTREILAECKNLGKVEMCIPVLVWRSQCPSCVVVLIWENSNYLYWFINNKTPTTQQLVCQNVRRLSEWFFQSGTLFSIILTPQEMPRIHGPYENTKCRQHPLATLAILFLRWLYFTASCFDSFFSCWNYNLWWPVHAEYERKM